MNHPKLLSDILAEGALSHFQENVLQHTLTASRRIRNRRRAIRVGALAALAGMVALLRFPTRAPIVAETTGLVPVHTPTSHTTLRTQPFAAVLRSSPLPDTDRLTSSATSLVILKTGVFPSPELRLLSDDQLLSFFQGQAVALVQRSPHQADLHVAQDTQ